MSDFGRRLTKLEIIVQAVTHRPPRRRSVDALTAEERAQIDAVIAKYEPFPLTPGGQPDLSGVSYRDLEFVVGIFERAAERGGAA